MNLVEAKTTTFIIEADNEDEIHDALGELDYTYFEKNCRWLTSEYEPPIIEDIRLVKDKSEKPICTKKQQDKIQKQFNKIMVNFTKMEADNE